jgi:sec-independent protein translocase protein TatA
MPGWIGPWEIAILLVVVLLVFGPKRLPEMGRSLGRGMREFKNSITGKDRDGEDDDEAPVALPAAEVPVEPEPKRVPASSRDTES